MYDLRGQQYSALTPRVYLGGEWFCTCECGNFKIAKTAQLLNGQRPSCGCLKRKRQSVAKTTHGKSREPNGVYACWQNMLERCKATSGQHFPKYGARGITVCERWGKFENFYADMGDRPEGMSLDRKDNDLGYSPDNCRWATPSEQSFNRRKYTHTKKRGAA